MLKLFISFFIFIFSYPQLQASSTMQEHQEPIYCQYADAIINPYCSYLKNHYKLHCYGSGGGFIENVNNIQLNFNGIKNLSIADTRVLIIECSQELLKRINEDTQIKPYLSHYPFTEKGLSFIISFDKKNGDSVDPDFIALAFTSNGMIYYKTYDSQTDLLKKVYEEPYQTALQIVNQTKYLKKPLTTEKEQAPSKMAVISQYIKGKFRKA